MPSSKFPLRILVVGREAGPIAQLLKKSFGHTKIGAIDVLGNLETRNFSDWKFSVIKQAPNSSLDRKKRRVSVNLLFELSKVMLEERKFDQLIPLAPFHKYPNLIEQFRNLCDVPLTTQESLEKVYSDFAFIENLKEEFPQFDPYYNQAKIKSILNDYKKGLMITRENRFFLTSRTKIESIKDLSTQGFYIPFSKIFCAGFFSINDFVNFLGFHELKPPEGNKFICKDLEKNSYYPYIENSTSRNSISTLVSIIKQLKLIGLITIFFGMIESHIIPFSCNVLPDENIDLWMSKTNNNFTPYIVKSTKSPNPPLKDPLLGFKIQIYPTNVLSVPPIPADNTTQRNLPGILADNKYPICAIFGTSNTYRNILRKISENRGKIQRILIDINP